MAKDISAVMTQLNIPKYYVCAHDRGARVAHKLMVDYPSQVINAIFLDIAPTLTMFEKTNQAFATAYWHWFFLIQKAPLPEMLITSKSRDFAELFMGGRLDDGFKTFNGEVFEIYVKQLGDEECVYGMCEDYRAAATLDLDEAREDLKNEKKIKSPLRVIWGERGIIGKMYDAVGEWKGVSESEVQGFSLDCGHYIPEEKPDELVKHIREFLV